jgi:hypothetical protein
LSKFSGFWNVLYPVLSYTLLWSSVAISAAAVHLNFPGRLEFFMAGSHDAHRHAGEQLPDDAANRQNTLYRPRARGGKN